MKDVIAFTLLAALVAVPTVAAVRAYGERIWPLTRKLARAAAFDPRHQGMHYTIR